MRHCNSAFKTAVKLVNWRQPATQGGRDHFDHPFRLIPNCLGFGGSLINQTMKESFIDRNDVLLCDSAVAAQVSHDDEANGIEPDTMSIAMKHSWTWKIPMLGRFGSGYVDSGRFCSTEDCGAGILGSVGSREKGISRCVT